MAREQLRQPRLGEAVSEVLGDFADLFQKELRLARAELSSNLSAKVRGSIWLGLAGLLGLLAIGLFLGALVAWITTLGATLHAAFLMVGGAVALLGAAAYFTGRSDAEADLTPTRTIEQVKQDIETTKDQLT